GSAGICGVRRRSYWSPEGKSMYACFAYTFTLGELPMRVGARGGAVNFEDDVAGCFLTIGPPVCPASSLDFSAATLSSTALTAFCASDAQSLAIFHAAGSTPVAELRRCRSVPVAEVAATTLCGDDSFFSAHIADSSSSLSHSKTTFASSYALRMSQADNDNAFTLALSMFRASWHVST